MLNYILPFEQCDHTQHHRVGGKCASLGALLQAGMRVPPGFAVTTDAFSAMLNTSQLRDQIQVQLQQLDSSDMAEQEKISHAIRQLIEATPLPSALEAAIRAAYLLLCQQVKLVDLPVAVRSSATAEDLPDASFAGQQDTYLWVVGVDAVIDSVRKCWSSLYTARAISYRRNKGFGQDQVLMSVGVQKMVNARTSGVAMTLNPLNGDRSKIVIDASWGLGEAVVSGEVTPDNFLVDKVVFEIVQQKIAVKQLEIIPDVVARHTIHRAIEGSRQTEPSISRDEVIALAKIARQLEKRYDAPQDIEWAIDADLPAGENLVLLQCRPETVWSQKSAPTLSAKNQMTGLMSVLNTFLPPAKVKK